MVVSELFSPGRIRPGPVFACHGQVAQLVEHWTENPGVGGSIPPLSTFRKIPFHILTGLQLLIQLESFLQGIYQYLSLLYAF
jgi:hypothetical protein